MEIHMAAAFWPLSEILLSKLAKAKLKASDAEDQPFPGVEEPAVYTIQQFIRAHNVSYGKFYSMMRDGTGPRTMTMGTRRVISVEAAREWRNKRTEEMPAKVKKR